MPGSVEWPEDETFKKFEQLLDKKVAAFVSNGGKIAPISEGLYEEECNCPVGAILGRRYPLFLNEKGLPGDPTGIYEFVHAFDGGFGANRPGPYSALGRAYRERFGYVNY
jgi:hypothetical protein